MVYFAANTDPEVIRSYLKRLQQVSAPDEDMIDRFTGIVVYRPGQDGAVRPAAVFRTSKRRARKAERKLPHSFALTLPALRKAIAAAKAEVENSAVFSRVAKLNLPELRKAEKNLIAKMQG